MFNTAPAAVKRSRKFINGKEYELRVVTIDPNITRQETKELLTDEAEYGRWELDRTRLYMGGRRKIWLRRRIMRIHRTTL